MATYKVNLIPPNLRKNETIIQIADSLDHLSRVVDDIMMRIEQRVENYNDKLKNVSNRVEYVENQIQRLRNVKNAIQVFSSSKYPASDASRNYVSIFPTDSEIPIIRHEVSQKYPLKRDEPIDKLHIYHVKLSKVEAEKTEGLGLIPNDVSCISDVILYNSGRNPYKQFTASKSLQLPISSVKTESYKIQIGNAPASIAERSFSNLPSQEYFYSPDLGDVPSLDVPVDLPDLPGIAGNVRYQEDSSFVIAPSISYPSILKNNAEDQSIPEDHLDDLPELTPTQTDSYKPEELPSVIKKVEVVEQEPEPIKQREVIIDKTQEKLPETQTTKLPLVADTRASLMEAIRNAGGTKVLKSVDAKSSSTKSESSSGDLMADLHAKLSMRRKGISGAKKSSESSELDSRGTLSLMSALIPPPEESNDETDQDEDWE